MGLGHLSCIASALIILCTAQVFSHSDKTDVFADLTEAEMQEVLDYLYSQESLAITPYRKGVNNLVYIRYVEAMNPTKSAALRYLDEDGRLPERRATAVLYRGNLDRPVIEELAIWPIPSPTQHEVINNPTWRKPIPYTSRSPLNPNDMPLISAFVANEIMAIDHILVQASGYSYNNCTKPKCLTWAPGGPAQNVPGKRTMIGYLIRNIEGKFLHPIGLQFVLDIANVNPDDWTTSAVWWQGQMFNNFQEMKAAYMRGELQIQNIPEPSSLKEDLPSSLNFRGTPRPKSPQRPRESSSPDGIRFTTSGRHVDWLGWSFDFNLRSSSGFQIHDLRFLGERLAYELSMQELSVFYSGGDPTSSHTVFFDSDALLGYSNTEIFPGVDCPHDAKFFSAVHYHNGKPKTFKNVICIFELDRGIPLRRHFASDYDGSYTHFQGMPDNVLVFRTIPTIDNYDYIIDVMLHQAGQVEVKTSLTGYVVATYYQGTEGRRYGHRVEDRALANIHHHLANFKVDLDVAGRINQFETLDIELEEIPDSLNPTKTILNRRVERRLKRKEREAAYQYNFDTPKYLVFTNNKVTNKFGDARGYRIYSANPSKVLLPSDYRGNRAWAWAKYQVAVTKYKDNEQRSSSMYNFEEPFDPVFSLQDYIDDNEDIVDEDLVAWVTLGAHHIPHSEDIPIVTTPSVQMTFFLLPYNYFDEDPSLASRDNIRVEKGKGDEYIYKYSGTAGHQYCEQNNVQCMGVVTSGTGINFSHLFEVLISLAVGLSFSLHNR